MDHPCNNTIQYGMYCHMRHTKDHWLEEGLQSLYKEGPAGLRIDRLCARLGVTKGSFYHHFNDLQNFQRLLLEKWETESTRAIIRQAQEAATPHAKIMALRELSAQIPCNPEIAIRAWARQDPSVRRCQQNVDRIRCQALEELYAADCSPDEARLRARLVCCIFIGAQQIVPAVDQRELDRLYDLVVRGMEDPHDCTKCP